VDFITPIFEYVRLFPGTKTFSLLKLLWFGCRGERLLWPQ